MLSFSLARYRLTAVLGICGLALLLVPSRSGSTTVKNTFSTPSISFIHDFDHESPSRVLENLIAQDRSLDLKSEYSGSLDARRWGMTVNAEGAPRFIGVTTEQPSVADDVNWDSRFGGSGSTGNVFSIAASGTDVYIGGQFTLVNNLLVNNVAKWNGSAWSALGNGVDGFISSIVVSGTDVYVAGAFTSASGVTVNNIAKWNGSSWSALGTGVNGEIDTMAASGGNVYVGGRFTSAGGTPANYIAKWNGSAWSNLGSGVNAFVSTIAANGSNVYVGGVFTMAGAVTVNSIARWDGANWFDLGGGVNSSVSSITVNGTDVYVGGFFSAAGGVPASYIARWNGSSWSALGAGVDNQVRAIAVSGTDVYAAGDFTMAAGGSAKRIAKWNGSSWFSLGGGIDGKFVVALGVSGGDLYVGGDFGIAGGISAHSIARWSSNAWNTVGNTPGLGMNDEVDAVSVNGTDTYAGGKFIMAAGVGANRIAKWNGNNWSALGSGVDNSVFAISSSGNDIYAGGDFTTAGGVSASRIARWNGSVWSALGVGVDNTVRAVAVSGTDVYVGGVFTSAGGASANFIAKWNGSSWSTLGSGTNNEVYAIAINGTDVYVGGAFTMAGGVTANHIAKWNGSVWSALGTGTDNFVETIAVNGTDIYAGGFFTTAGGVSANRVARWNGNTWSALGTGISGHILSITISGTDVYVGGSIATAGPFTTGGIAKWDGANWSTLGSGTDFEVSSVATSGNGVYVGGVFRSAGKKPSFFFGHWTNCSFSIMPANQTFSASGGNNSVTVLTTSGCDWTAISNDPWIQINTGGSGSGNGTVTYSVSANTGPARTGTMTIAGQTFTVMQDSGCSFVLNPTSSNFGAGGGNDNVTVTTAGGCNWNATSNDNFITINSGSSGTGTGNVSYSVAANVSTPRSGTMTIAGQTFTVNQAGATWTVSGRITDGTNGLSGIAVGLTGASTANTTTNSTGNYSFASLPAGGTYSVGPTSLTYNFTPQLRTFADLNGNRTADFIGTLQSQPTPTPSPTIELFNGPRDPEVWNLGTLTEPSAYDPAVSVVQENGRLKITPRANVTGAHINGYTSVQSFDMTDSSASIEVVQPGTGGAETMFGLSTGNGNTYFRFTATTASAAARAGALMPEGNISPANPDETLVLMLQSRINGVNFGPFALTYDPAVDRYWRIRHDSLKGGRRNPIPQLARLDSLLPNITFTPDSDNGDLLFETTSNTNGPWITRLPRIPLLIPIRALQIELAAGSRTLVPQPGDILFDNLAVRSNPVVEFNASAYSVNEGAGVANVTITRTGDTSTSASVDLTVGNNIQAPCNTLNGIAVQNCDYIVNSRTLNFLSGETSKNFGVLIVDDAYVEGNETLELKLSNPNGGDVLGATNTSVLTIVDNDLSPPTTSPLDVATFFVRQHYYDFLNREPDPGGLDYWATQIGNCGNDQICLIRKRVDVSAAYFGEPEFQRTGSFVYRAFKGGLGRRPSFQEFLIDRPQIIEGPNLEQTKQTYMAAFVQRQEFMTKYANAPTAATFVDALIASIQVNSNVDLVPARQALIDKYNLGANMDQSRALATREAIDSAAFQAAELNRAFVLMQYFGYLGRDIDQGGYDFWLDVLNNRVPGNFRGMVCAFITSPEYQQRFSGLVTHTDHECGPPAFP